MKHKKSILIIFIFIYTSISIFGQNKTFYYEQAIDLNSSDEKQEIIINNLKKIEKEYLKKINLRDSVLAKIYHFIGRNYWVLEDLDNAQKYTQLAININLKPLKSSKFADLANSFLNLGLIKSKNNEYNIAIKYFDLSKIVAARFKDKNNVLSMAYGQLANSYFVIGEYEKSILCSKKGYENALKNNDIENFAKNIIEKSQTEIALNKLDDAQKTINFGIENNTIDKTSELFGYLLSHKGQIFKLNKQYLEAYITLNQAFNRFIKNNNKNGCTVVQTELGLMNYEQKKYKEAIENYKKAFQFVENEMDKARIFNNISAAYLELKDFTNSLHFIQKAINTYPIGFRNINIATNPSPNSILKVPNKEYLFVIMADKASFLSKIGQFQNSKNYLKIALNTFVIADKMIDYMRHEHQGTQSKYFWRNKTRPIYEAAIETSFLLKDYEKAFYFFEKSRSAMLNDKLNELGAKQKLSEIDQQKERDFQRKIIEKTSNIEAEKNEKIKEKLNIELNEIQEKSDQFKKSLEIKNPAYYQLKYDTSVASLTQIQKYLKVNFKDENATFLHYFMGDSAHYAMVITAQKAELKKINFDTNLANNFMNLVSANIKTKSELSAFNTVSKKLYSQLIGPLNINKGHLIISQDGSLLPFEALINSQTNQYLLENMAISYTYSAQFLLKNQQNNSFLPQHQFIGFAPVNFSKNLGSLIGSKKSIETLGANYFFNSKYIDKKANKRNFLNQANKYQIVHLYTHALADSNENEPRIYFADSSLKVSELSAENRFSTSLIVLSACNTGVGKLAKGEGVLSLARGFSMLGIPSTITSLWSVQDVDTYAVTELFYKYLNKGLPKNDALQKAKLEFLSLNPNASPSQWAGLVLLGETDPILNNYNLYIFIVMFLITLLLGLFFLKKRKTKKYLPAANAV